MTTRLIQIQKDSERRVGLVCEPRIELMDTANIYDLIWAALESGVSIYDLVDKARKGIFLDYDAIYAGKSEWKLLPCFDHPRDAAHCVISGTGNTHLGTAVNRDEIHRKALAAAEETLTDSQKMFRWGLERGKPKPGETGVAPQLFFKGDGQMLRGHGAALEVPSFAMGGGEEAEIVGVYLIDEKGQPVRVGMCQGNEFADQGFEKKNPLNQAGAKLRTCSAGPELVIGGEFETVRGNVRILRGEVEVWAKPQLTGEGEMSHSLENLEHHLFKYPHHRRAGDVHMHYLGTSGTSSGAGVKLENGDVMEIGFEGFGRKLRNTVADGVDKTVAVRTLR